MLPGSLRGIVIHDLRAAQTERRGRNVDVSDIQLLGTATPRAITPDDDLNHAGLLLFSAPDGHPWAAQQITARP